MVNRQKRTTQYLVLITCQATYRPTCISTLCRVAFLESIRQRCFDIINIFLQLQIDNRFIDFILQFILFSLTSIKDN